MRSRTFILTGGFVLLSLLEIAHFQNQLPDSIAIHFDLQGNASGWASRKTAFALDIGLTLFLAVNFLGMGALISQLPPQMINIPNRDYWLAPERKAATIQQIQNLLDAIGVSTLAFFRIVMHDVYTAAAAQPPHGLKYTVPALILYIAILAFFIYRTIAHFRMKKTTVA